MAEPVVAQVGQQGEVNPVVGKLPKEIEDAVNDRLASCAPVKIGEDEFDIKVSLKKKAAAVVKEQGPEQGPEGPEGTKGGKRNKRKTLSKRSARKSHKSRRVFGGKRK